MFYVEVSIPHDNPEKRLQQMPQRRPGADGGSSSEPLFPGVRVIRVPFIVKRDGAVQIAHTERMVLVRALRDCKIWMIIPGKAICPAQSTQGHVAGGPHTHQPGSDQSC